ncbi:PqqD family protein [Methylacidiphilum caldifontis]|uniref:Pyrroloquinoline quinone biosynthesis protein PqqD n=1 Tax=Methylacidiphilum caldifontis TaxID=2795386 RepID=A0A4Y8P8N1_9BACT|nr:PqqD family protein [Methylacidiphilum caldifontis]TFE66986.1 pyrroloquinoline quinone biosynthesis protein PqqD [Methylacidiphilum caldifontis]
MDVEMVNRVEIPDWICYERIDNEIIMVDPTTWQYYKLDNYGAVLWEKLVALKGDVKALKNWVFEHFEADPQQMGKDIDLFIQRLVENGILVKPEVEKNPSFQG